METERSCILGNRVYKMKIQSSLYGDIQLIITGNSDPGTSAVLSPFGQIEGLYFNNSSEPDDFEFNFKKDLSRVLEEEGVERIEIKADNKEDYYKILDQLYEFNKGCITVSGTSKEKYTLIVEEYKDLDVDPLANEKEKKTGDHGKA